MSVNKLKLQRKTENKVDTYKAPVFAPDYSASVLAVQKYLTFLGHMLPPGDREWPLIYLKTDIQHGP
jgi:hypothetical protein